MTSCSVKIQIYTIKNEEIERGSVGVAVITSA